MNYTLRKTNSSFLEDSTIHSLGRMQTFFYEIYKFALKLFYSQRKRYLTTSITQTNVSLTHEKRVRASKTALNELLK